MLVHKLLNAAQSGGTAVLYLLIGLSVLSVTVVVDRWLYFRRRRVDAAALGQKLLELLRAGDRTDARQLLEKTRGVEPEILLQALAWYDDGAEAVEKVLESQMRDRRRELEGGLLFLGTVGNNAPFIGLFGTVLGVLTAFRELGTSTAGAMGNVMSGIAEALVATAVGLLVALPAVVAYNVFQKKSTDIEENVGVLGALVLAEMKSKRPVAVAVRRKAAVNGESVPAAEAVR
ncbi:MAG TPA: MotA/TolQ/ExbB proton channel family protein [Polyangia bacterium]|jgi:biopolymer transport protein ExbB/biopolymer transport protein TolQ|nr:MotA/TolQ/ExbB proton channel family protein [Polyangia bacterium]